MNNHKKAKETSSSKPKVKTFVFLTDEIAERLRFEAFSERTSKSAIAENALQEYFHRLDYVEEAI